MNQQPTGVLTLLAALCAATFSVQAQDKSVLLEKPQKVFWYPQLNLAGGYDTAEPGDGWGLADKGSRSQVALEVFSKLEERIQRGYTPSISPVSWAIKLGVELDPDEDDASDVTPRLRMYDTWLKFDTKWDRTSIWVGHKSIPYGHNPRLDPSHSFLPNQAGLDICFGRDTGLFLKTPTSAGTDLEMSVTAGKGDTWDYHGGWLVTGRWGTPTYAADEIGIFALGGEIQGVSGARTTSQELTGISRIGADWVHKSGEVWKAVNQVSVGADQDGPMGDRLVGNLLNSLEWFVSPQWSVGGTHALLHEKPQEGPNSSVTQGRLFGSLSYATTRNSRLRLNAYADYYDTDDDNDFGVFLQFCWGCGLTK